MEYVSRLDGSEGRRRGLKLTGYAAGMLAFAAVAVIMGWETVRCLLRGQIIDVVLDFAAAAAGGWYTAYCLLSLERLLTSVRLTPQGVEVIRPWLPVRKLGWEEFQQVCICRRASEPVDAAAPPVICFVLKGEKRNRFGRWRADNPFHYHRILTAHYSLELHEAANACAPAPLEDLRGTSAYPDA